MERVWFDALCINQMDTGEKDREICHMGAYYALSQGCYVSCHGIGVGYHALDCGTGDVPRWFTRVWTIQECILPRKLTFIVQKFDNATLEALEELSAAVRGYAGYLADRNASSIQAAEVDVVTPLSSNGLSIGVYFQRRVENHGGQEELYFLDSNDYSHMLMHQYLAWAGMRGVQSMTPIYERLRVVNFSLDRRAEATPGKYEFFALEDWVSQASSSAAAAAEEEEDCTRAPPGCRIINSAILQAVGGLEGYWEHRVPSGKLTSSCINPLLAPEILAVQVMERHCSVEEDRVLSILALLGMRGQLQLRTGKDLQDQFLNLARVFNEQSPRLLLNLCAVHSSNNGVPNMSWAPDMRHRADWPEVPSRDGSRRNVLIMNDLLCISLYIRFYAADVLGMDRVGRIKLLAKACQGCLMAAPNEEYWMEVNGLRLLNATGGRVSANVFELGFERTRPPPYPAHFYYRNISEMLHDNDGLAFCRIHLSGTGVHLLAEVQAPSPILVCNIWLVLLGYTDDNDGNGKGRLQVLLLCLRGPGEDGELHKIGTMFLLESAYINFSSTMFTKWKLGGFGPDVSKFLAWGRNN